ncbi:zf-CCHC domain-containing protein/UBN2 domain-containing protein, partial [Cephalotus follicularis]
DIINALKGLGKVYTNHELVSKILRCLPKSLEPKVIAIEEANDLSTFSLEDLLGSLMTHELRMSDQARNEPKKKTIALKASKDNESEEEDMALLIICYECDKSGHIRPDCPKLKKKDKIKKKTMIATWSDIDESSSDDEESEEAANIAFMAMEDDCEVTMSSLSYNEMQSEYNELLDVLNELNREYQLLKKIAKVRTKENVELKNCILEMKKDESIIEKNSSLEKENSEFKLEIDGLRKTFSKFSSSNDKLDRLLGMQRCVFDRASLAF